MERKRVPGGVPANCAGPSRAGLGLLRSQSACSAQERPAPPGLCVCGCAGLWLSRTPVCTGCDCLLKGTCTVLLGSSGAPEREGAWVTCGPGSSVAWSCYTGRRIAFQIISRCCCVFSSGHSLRRGKPPPAGAL